jgi:DNA-binding response OmpR family regulator
MVKLRVLLALRPGVFRTEAEAALRRSGFGVSTADSGLACLAAMRRRVPDVLVIEPNLPWGGSEGVLAVMAESMRNSIMPVLVLATEEDRRVVGIDPNSVPVELVQGPLNSEQVVSCVARLATRPAVNLPCRGT